MSARFRWGVEHLMSKYVIQVGNEKPRFVLAEENGEGDCVGLGEATDAPVAWGPWQSMRGAPDWLSPSSSQGTDEGAKGKP